MLAKAPRSPRTFIKENPPAWKSLSVKSPEVQWIQWNPRTWWNPSRTLKRTLEKLQQSSDRTLTDPKRERKFANEATLRMLCPVWSNHQLSLDAYQVIRPRNLDLDVFNLSLMVINFALPLNRSDVIRWLSRIFQKEVSFLFMKFRNCILFSTQCAVSNVYSKMPSNGCHPLDPFCQASIRSSLYIYWILSSRYLIDRSMLSVENRNMNALLKAMDTPGYFQDKRFVNHCSSVNWIRPISKPSMHIRIFKLLSSEYQLDRQPDNYPSVIRIWLLHAFLS